MFTLVLRQTWRKWETEDSETSDVSDGTFAVFLNGDFYVGSGNVAFLPALLPRPGPAVAFILFYDVQDLRGAKEVTFKRLQLQFDDQNILLAFCSASFISWLKHLALYLIFYVINI